MKTICLYFQIHQPYRLRNYRFFDIGNDHFYYDEFANRTIMQKIAANCYLPANKILLELIEEFGASFKVSFSISGIALDQLEKYAPEVLDSFKELSNTGCVEFLSETYSHSLSSLADNDQFAKEVKQHAEKIKSLFGQEPKAFRNTELIYSDEIGKRVADMGFKSMLTEGAKHILGWKSPNYLYFNTISKKLKILLKNYKLSDDIAFRFSNQGWEHWPLTVDKYVGWLKEISPEEEIINLFLDYETFGEHQKEETGIFDFLKAFPASIIKSGQFEFLTISEATKKHQPVAPFSVPYPISWADEERDVTAWLGNELQNDAFQKLYEINGSVAKIKSPEIQSDWDRLKTSDHFYYMCTKYFADGDVHKYFNPYESPYDAFINYMNVLSDFISRVELEVEKTKKEIESEDITELNTLLKQYEKAIGKIKKKIASIEKK